MATLLDMPHEIKPLPALAGPMASRLGYPRAPRDTRWIRRCPRRRSRHLPPVRHLRIRTGLAHCPGHCGCCPRDKHLDGPCRRAGIIRPAAICVKPSPGQSASTKECHLRPKSWAERKPGRQPAGPYANPLHAGAKAADFHAVLAKPPVRPAPHTVTGDDS